jgi:hypothetical protein
MQIADGPAPRTACVLVGRPSVVGSPPAPAFRPAMATLEDNLGLLDPDTEETPPTAIPDGLHLDADWEVEEDVVPAVAPGVPRPSRPPPPEPAASSELPALPRCFPSVTAAEPLRAAPEPEPAETDETGTATDPHGAPVASWVWLVLGLLLGADLALLIGRLG